ncbi:SAM-dependent methyltransferase [Microbispora sp. RL4-1S]|uniref:SAM-dependent methyltransferase n=1 Tax=Microbispora oryzae TaxID=2806554 RepID=A0A940WIU7_9ACTN|nr:SAM-dependent methyltransferase [Microbispora oryzae]MBP2704047.1 SAM-dependent methyltransferase [Microbispora oryzae]
MSGSDRRGVAGFDTRTANIARMSDYLLGGKDNFSADREFAERLLAMAPEVKTMAVDTRLFIERVIRFLVERGVTQFLNIASGLPTQRNTHEVAQELHPGARVVYVDDDPVVLTHARAVLATNPDTGVVRGNLLRPAEILSDPETLRLIDLSRPVGLLIPARLQYVPDADEPYKCVAYLRDRLAPGSHLAIGHAVFDSRPELAAPVIELFRQITPRVDHVRNRDDVLRFFEGTSLVDPGLVYIRQWRAGRTESTARAQRVWIVGGVGLIS